jgi:hypothetical protein
MSAAGTGAPMAGAAARARMVIALVIFIFDFLRRGVLNAWGSGDVRGEHIGGETELHISSRRDPLKHLGPITIPHMRAIVTLITTPSPRMKTLDR